MTTIQLGFEVGSGEPVAIPLGHMAVTGQTQMAGKTTALEALAARSELRVLAFITKRGEGAFRKCHRIPPIFTERADWQFVQALLEATLRERLKFERGWIMRASKGAKTLADVQKNVRSLMVTAKGLSADVYLQLDEYLKIVVPQIGKTRFVSEIDLIRGAVNVMDLSGFSLEMQSLVMRSALEWIYQHEKDTITIIPEAWEFLPRSRKSPVSLAAEELIRKGASLRNYLWIDSQDLAGVHTPILKSVHVWLLGVQREINEIKRTLNHIHGVKKPKPDAVAALALGQFIACYGSKAIPTYVQPCWMSEPEARSAAITGEILGVDRFTLTEEENDMVDQQKLERLESENAELRGTITALQAELEEFRQALGRQCREPAPPTPAPLPDVVLMTARNVRKGEAVAFAEPPAGWDPEAVYQAFKARLTAEAPQIVKVLTHVPEFVVTLQRRVVELDGATPKGRLARMVAQGLLEDPVKPGVIIKEFARTGGQIHPSRLSDLLGEFVGDGLLTREDSGLYRRAPNVKVTTKDLSVS